MPTYAYRCSDCGHEFDIYQQFSDDALTECPECGGKLRKVFGSLGVTFNGSGFYRTDSRSGSGSGSGSGSSGSGSAGASSGTGSASGGSPGGAAGGASSGGSGSSGSAAKSAG